MTSDYNIHRLLEDYIQHHTEIINIRKDIQNYQKQYKNRLEYLKKHQLQSETEILKYLEQNQLPGIKKGDFVIMADEKPIQIKKNSKKEKIQSIFKNYQIDSNSQLAQDITNMVIQSRSNDKIKYIKCKPSS